MPKNGVAVAEHQAPAEDQEGQRRDGEHDEVLGQDVDAFLARQRPLSTIAKPRFMKNTSIAVIIVQSVSLMTFGVASSSVDLLGRRGRRLGGVLRDARQRVQQHQRRRERDSPTATSVCDPRPQAV